MPVGAKTLWPEKHVEVAVERLHVDRHVRDGLRAVDEHARAVAMRHRRSSRAPATMVPSAFETCVNDDEPRPRAEQLLVLLEDDLAAIVDRRDPQARALLGAELLPGDDVGVVLEPGDDDLVARADVAPAPALRDEVDRLGRAADEDDVLASTAR